jgi:hypothetical protein
VQARPDARAGRRDRRHTSGVRRRLQPHRPRLPPHPLEQQGQGPARVLRGRPGRLRPVGEPDHPRHRPRLRRPQGPGEGPFRVPPRQHRLRPAHLLVPPVGLDLLPDPAPLPPAHRNQARRTPAGRPQGPQPHQRRARPAPRRPLLPARPGQGRRPRADPGGRCPRRGPRPAARRRRFGRHRPPSHGGQPAPRAPPQSPAFRSTQRHEGGQAPPETALRPRTETCRPHQPRHQPSPRGPRPRHRPGHRP